MSQSRSRSASPAADEKEEGAISSGERRAVSRSPSPERRRSRSPSSSESEEVASFFDQRAQRRRLAQSEREVAQLRQRLVERERLLFQQKLALVDLELEATAWHTQQLRHQQANRRPASPPRQPPHREERRDSPRRRAEPPRDERRREDRPAAEPSRRRARTPSPERQPPSDDRKKKKKKKNGRRARDTDLYEPDPMDIPLGNISLKKDGSRNISFIQHQATVPTDNPAYLETPPVTRGDLRIYERR